MKHLLPLILLALLLLTGCGGGEQPKAKKSPKKKKPVAEAPAETPSETVLEKEKEDEFPPLTAGSHTPARENADDDPMPGLADLDGASTEEIWERLMESDRNTPFKKRQFGAEITEEQGDTPAQAFRNYPRIHIDDAHAEANGLSVLRSERLTLITDMDITPAIRNLLPAVDAAYPQMCKYFGLHEDDAWTLTAFLMRDDMPFIGAGYLPKMLPPFRDGYAFNHDCWLYDQPSDYYRQHLLLHEMVHCLMLTTLGKTGPLWMTEGYAEYFGMHDFAAREVTLGFMPPDKEAVPYCARIRELRDRVAAGRGRTFREVFDMKYKTFPNNEVYIWSWAMMWFLANHPETKDTLQELGRGLATHRGAAAEITDALLKSLGDKLPAVERHWLMYIASLDYNYALEPMVFDVAPGSPLASGGKKVVTLEADKGWQDTGIQVKAGDVLRIRGAGSFTLGNEDGKAWPCEPGGVTIRYVMGHPRGMLLAAVCPEDITPDFVQNPPAASFFAPVAVGLNGTLTAEFSGILMLRINDAPAMLEKNSGSLKAEVSKR